MISSYRNSGLSSCTDVVNRALLRGRFGLVVASRHIGGLVDGSLNGSRCVALGLLNWKWLTVVEVCCGPALSVAASMYLGDCDYQYGPSKKHI